MKFSRLLPLAFSLTLSLAAGAMAQDTPFQLRTWGDQGDGTFKNTLLPGDFSDPDVIRVGSDYYLINSTFQYSPGMAIMHSKDLVNWQYIGHCIPDVSAIGPELNWDRMNRYNRGVYAGSLRYHDGKFWMFTTTLDEGIFMTTATNPAGPWEPPYRISAATGYDDNCPFWDDNGEAWMLASKPGATKWWTYLYKMSADGRSIDMSSETVVDSQQGSEGNKIMKINGWYYIFHNQIDGPGNRTGYFMRATSMAGPWEKKLFLWGSGTDNDREPNQGGLVDTPDGKWWFITHQGRGGYYEGRASHLLPVKWVDGWPVVDAPGPGVLVPQATKPVSGFPAQLPQTSDDFSTADLAHQWEWNFAPRNTMWSLTARPGWMRLSAWPSLSANNFFKVGNTLTQRVLGTSGGEIVVKADVSGMANGQFGGVCAFWSKAGLLGVVQTSGVRKIQLRNDTTTTTGSTLPGTDVWFKLAIDASGGCTFAYSFNGITFTPIGGRFAFGWANYRGTRFGLFTWNDSGTSGRIDFDSFRYDVGGLAKPAAPVGLAAAPVSANQINLSWNASGGASSYQLERSTNGTTGFSLLASNLTSPAYSDPGLAYGATWFYRVSAVNPIGTSTASNVASATTYTQVQAWRSQYFGTIDNAGDAADEADPDGDAMTNGQEFVSGTIPTNNASVFKVTEIQQTPQGVTLKFTTELQKTYRIEGCSTLQPNSWTTIQDNLAGTGGVVTHLIPAASLGDQHFFRVVVR